MRKCTLEKINTLPKQSLAKVEGLAGELLDECEVYEPYGFASSPIQGDGLLSDISSNLKVVTQIQDKDRSLTKLDLGDVAVYGKMDTFTETAKNATQRMTFANDGSLIIKINSITIECKPDGTINIIGTTINSSGEWNHTGKITASTDVVGGGISLKTHKHTSSASGSPTSVPL